MRNRHWTSINLIQQFNVQAGRQFANDAGRWFDIDNHEHLWNNPEGYLQWRSRSWVTLRSGHEVSEGTWAHIHGQGDNLRLACETMNATNRGWFRRLRNAPFPYWTFPRSLWNQLGVRSPRYRIDDLVGAPLPNAFEPANPFPSYMRDIDKRIAWLMEHIVPLANAPTEKVVTKFWETAVSSAAATVASSSSSSSTRNLPTNEQFPGLPENPRQNQQELPSPFYREGEIPTPAMPVPPASISTTTMTEAAVIPTAVGTPQPSTPTSPAMDDIIQPTIPARAPSPTAVARKAPADSAPSSAQEQYIPPDKKSRPESYTIHSPDRFWGFFDTARSAETAGPAPPPTRGRSPPHAVQEHANTAATAAAPVLTPVAATTQSDPYWATGTDQMVDPAVYATAVLQASGMAAATAMAAASAPPARPIKPPPPSHLSWRPKIEAMRQPAPPPPAPHSVAPTGSTGPAKVLPHKGPPTRAEMLASMAAHNPPDDSLDHNPNRVQRVRFEDPRDPPPDDNMAAAATAVAAVPTQPTPPDDRMAAAATAVAAVPTQSTAPRSPTPPARARTRQMLD